MCSFSHGIAAKYMQRFLGMHSEINSWQQKEEQEIY
jgi:hypothetical protein